MPKPVVTPPVFARPFRFRDFLGVSEYVRDLHRTLTLGLGHYADALNTGVAQYGTWTPAITASSTAGTPTYTRQAGMYTLRGADVAVWATLQLADWTGSPAGDVTITGLPFTSTATPEVYVAMPAYAVSGVNLSANYTSLWLELDYGTSTLNLRETGDNVTQANVQASAVATTAFLVFSGAYRTNLT